MDCIFCKIIKGDIPSLTIYEDEMIKVILDTNPVADGHSLILPKEHFVDMFDIKSETLEHIQEVAKNLYSNFKEKLKCDGITLCQNNGYGQEIKHYHLHMIPRYENDGIKMATEATKLNPKEVFAKLK